MVSGHFLGSVCGETDGNFVSLSLSMSCGSASVFFHFNQLDGSFEGTKSKRVRESKNSASLAVYVQRLIHSVSVLPLEL